MVKARNYLAFGRSWEPDAPPRAHLLLAHGYAEHSGRYEALAAAFNTAGLHVHVWDHRGHGHSAGKRGYIDCFADLVSDFAGQVEQVKKEAGDNPLFVLGHSMGGLVLAHYLALDPSGIQGAVFSSPLMAIPEHVSPWLLRVSRFLSAAMPWLPVGRLDSRGIARDEAVVRAYDADPLVYHGPIRARTGAELAGAIMDLDSLLPRIAVPMLVFHGTADSIAPQAGSQWLVDRAGSQDKTCFFVVGGFHELMNDTGRDEVIRSVIAWIENHRHQ